jgi:hypothetical protein
MFTDAQAPYHQRGTFALNPVRTAAPTKHLLTREEAKLHLRVDGNDEETLIDMLIAVVTAQLDGWSGMLGRALLSRPGAPTSIASRVGSGCGCPCARFRRSPRSRTTTRPTCSARWPRASILAR